MSWKLYTQSGFQLSVESNLRLLCFCFTSVFVWLSKFAPLSSPNEKQNQNQSRDAHVHFPALGSRSCLRLLWLVRVILKAGFQWSISISKSTSISISTSENSRDINISISRNIRKTNPLICLVSELFVFLVLMLMLMSSASLVKTAQNK